MDIAELQTWTGQQFGERLDTLSLDYGVARLLVQSGQLGEVVLEGGDVEKEIADVMFVLLAIAWRSGVDLDEAVRRHLVEPADERFAERLKHR